MSTRSAAAAAARTSRMAVQAVQADADHKARRLLGERDAARTIVCALDVAAGTYLTTAAASAARGWSTAVPKK